ncbi:MAG: exodeoxyribonuclease III [Peptostreptococcaceae bacterium]|nr:exodeoxyribonuclease III [Peptostreptococcaceae bacterium]
MKFISWNVNGFRACLKKGFEDFFYSVDSDFFCLQETKMQEGQADFSPEGYHQYFNSAIKKGYSGVAVFAKNEPLSVSMGINGNHNDEGRVLTLEYDDFFLVCCYTPNSKEKLARLDYRMEFEDDFRKYLLDLKEKKSIILCGDLNVAHNEIDLKNPKSNRKNPGFSDEERAKMTELLSSGFIDSFRHLYPDLESAYSWWSYRFNARANNAGWRIDYFIVSDDIKNKINESKIYAEILGSDHCPVGIDIF